MKRILLILLAVLITVDTVQTVCSIELGFSELNPVIMGLLKINPYLVLLKSVPFFCLLLLWNSAGFRATAYSLNIFHLVIVSWNFYVLAGL